MQISQVYSKSKSVDFSGPLTERLNGYNLIFVMILEKACMLYQGTQNKEMIRANVDLALRTLNTQYTTVYYSPMTRYNLFSTSSKHLLIMICSRTLGKNT